MDSIFPFKALQTKFEKSVHIDQYGLGQYSNIMQLKSDGIIGLVMNVWNRIVHNPDQSVDPLILRRMVSVPNSMDAPTEFALKIIEAIETVIGSPLLRDISYSCCTISNDPAVDKKPIAELLIAHVYPNTLHIADVTFRNPYKPIPPSNRCFEFQSFV